MQLKTFNQTYPRLFVLVILLSISLSCSIFFPSNKSSDIKDKKYNVLFNNNGWRNLSSKDTDFVFQNNNGDILMANSFCHEFQHLSLDKLAMQTINNLSQSKLIQGSFGEFKGRESYQALAHGSMDGINVQIKIQNYRRNHCYYDFILITQEMTDDLTLVFLRFLESVEFK